MNSIAYNKNEVNPTTTYSSSDEISHKIEQCYHDQDGAGMYEAMQCHAAWRDVPKVYKTYAKHHADDNRINALLDIAIDGGLC